MNLNKVFLLGRLTNNPENRVLPSGQSVASFGLATSRFFTDKNNQKQQQTDFHNIVLFGKLADIANQYLKKGSLVLIEGRIQTRSWQGSDGSKKYRTEIIGERLQLGPKSAAVPQPIDDGAKEIKDQAVEEIPIIEESENTEIDIKDIPF
ncbi:MAG: single-stranded DNA-binding protein [Minisyncoccales bacterium]